MEFSSPRLNGHGPVLEIVQWQRWEERLMGHKTARNVSYYWLEPAAMKYKRQRANVGKHWIPSSDKNWKVGDLIPKTDMDVKRELKELKSIIAQQQNEINLLKDELAAVKADLRQLKDERLWSHSSGTGVVPLPVINNSDFKAFFEMGDILGATSEEGNDELGASRMNLENTNDVNGSFYY